MSKALSLCAVFCLVIGMSGLGNASVQLTTDEMKSDFQFLNAMVQSGYGPLEYKRDTQSIDFFELKESYLKKIETLTSNEDFYYLVIKYIGEFHDGHFGASLPTDYQSNIGIHTDLFQGQVLITDIDRKELTEKVFPANVGDEIVALDGVSVALVIEDIKAAYGSGYDLTEVRIGSWLLFHRRASKLKVPKGKVKVSVRRGDTNIVEDFELTWLHKGTELKEELRPTIIPSSLLWTGVELAARADYDEINMDLLLEQLPESVVAANYMCKGSTRVAVPQGATYIMKTPFVAYYYPTPKGNVGYLRIPHYSPKNKLSGAAEYDLRFLQYEYAIATLEKNTVGLVIDQDSNCGGSVLYLEKMLGLFMQSDYQPMQFRLLASKESYLDFKEWMDETNKHTLDYANLKKVSDLILSSWLAGDFLTSKIAIHGRPNYVPNPVRYTKPILVLIDEMAGSGGDAFPSLIQGYGRAKLLGNRTSGLGGHISSLPALPFSRISTRMTKSLFYRPDGVEVENNGAVPDFNYLPSRADLLNKYLPYRSFYTEKLLGMLPE